MMTEVVYKCLQIYCSSWAFCIFFLFTSSAPLCDHIGAAFKVVISSATPIHYLGIMLKDHEQDSVQHAAEHPFFCQNCCKKGRMHFCRLIIACDILKYDDIWHGSSQVHIYIQKVHYQLKELKLPK